MSRRNQVYNTCRDCSQRKKTGLSTMLGGGNSVNLHTCIAHPLEIVTEGEKKGTSYFPLGPVNKNNRICEHFVAKF